MIISSKSFARATSSIHVRCLLGTVVSLSLFTGCGRDRPEFGTVSHLYETWCSYLIESDQTNDNLIDCVVDQWNNDQSDSEPLYQTFKTLAGLNRYIAAEATLISLCEQYKDRPTPYEQMIGVTRIGSLSTEECIWQFTEMGRLDEALDDVILQYAVADFTPQRRGGYVINGQIYNDPYGLDFRNDEKDFYGDGR